MIKNKNHDKIVKNYEKQKSKHLEKLASQLIKNADKTDKLKEKIINPNILKIFK